MGDLLVQFFTAAGNTPHATPTGFRTGHEPVHPSSSGTCVAIDTDKDVWYCHSCQQGGGVVDAVMSLQGLSRTDAEAYVQAQSGQAPSAAAPKETLADKLVRGVLRRAELFHDENGEPWAIVPVGTHRETMALTDKPFRRWLSHAFYKATGKSPNAEALSQAILTLAGEAVYEGTKRQLAWRVAQQGDTILYDLADADWRVVVITPHGWTITQQPGLFRRGGNTAPQVEPQTGGHLAAILDFLPPMSPAHQLLVQVYLVTCLVPTIDHPIPEVAGDHGAAKSTATAVLRCLVDPAQEALLSLPNDQNELALLLAHNYMPAFDNLDGMQSWQMDMLCRACTGGGISKRKLYTDEGEVILKFWRCVVLNGIYPGATKPDILDRVLPLHFTRLTKAQNKRKTVFWATFETARPRILGAMLDTLSQAMRLYPAVRLSGLPRMGDFCVWGYAVAEDLGGQGDAFLAAYMEAIGAQNNAALENHPVATAVIAFLGGREAIAQKADGYLFWEGPATELLNKLENEAVTQRIDTKAKSWPKAPHILTRRLNEVKSNLLDIGVKYASESRGTTRQVTFHKSSENSVSSVSSVKDMQNQPVSADATANAPDAFPAHSVSAPAEDLTLLDAPDATTSPADATGNVVASDENPPLHKGLKESDRAPDAPDATFGPRGEGYYIEVGATTEGLLPEYITSSAQLDAVLPMLCAAPLLAVDTETTGLDPLTAHVRLIQFALPDRVIVVDAGQVPVQRLVPVFTASHLLAFHNAKFDLKFLRTAGLPWPISSVFDTMLAAQLLGAGMVDGQLKQCGLAAVAQRYLSLDLDKTLQTSDWTGTLTPAQLCYAARDAQVTLQLVSPLRDALAAAALEQVAAIEYRCIPALTWLELAGLPIDAQRWRDRAKQDAHQAQALEAQLHTILARSSNGSGHLFPEALNWQSPQQVLALLQHRGHAITKTDSETLTALGDADPLIPLLLDYREAMKRAGTYGTTWLDQALHPTTGRVHAEYLQLGSRAGRMSCSKPNVQNLPRTKTYRGCITPEPGSCIVKADYSQIELRIAAVIAQDAAMLTAYQAWEDLHTATAARLLGVPSAEVTGDHRQLAKAINFGLLYGMGARTLQGYAWTNWRVRLSPEEAQQYKDGFFTAYPGLQRWHRETGATQPTETRTLAGRRRLGIKAFTERLNSPVQGTGADGLKWALARLFAHRHEAPDARLVAVVHDELVVECPMEAAAQTTVWLQHHMTAAMSEILHDAVPVVVETTIGQDWAGTPLPQAQAS
jgi:DNA polymerase-1